MTYREWDARTNRLARALAALGVRPPDGVAFLLAGGGPMASLHLAVQKLAAVSVPLSIRFGPPRSPTAWTTPPRALSSATT